MSDAGLVARIQRIYAALDETVEGDLSQFPPTVVDNDRVFAIHQDFIGGLSGAQLENAAHSLIHNIANFPDQIRA